MNLLRRAGAARWSLVSDHVMADLGLDADCLVGVELASRDGAGQGSNAGRGCEGEVKRRLEQGSTGPGVGAAAWASLIDELTTEAVCHLMGRVCVHSLVARLLEVRGSASISEWCMLACVGAETTNLASSCGGLWAGAQIWRQARRVC